MEISCTDRVRKEEEVLHGVKGKRNIILTVKRRKANWIGHVLSRNCLLRRYWRKDRRKGIGEREEKEEDVSCYCLNVRKREDTGN